MPSFALTSGRKFSTTTSAFSASRLNTSSPLGSFRLSVIARLLRCRFWKSEPWRRPSRLSGRRIPQQRIDLDDIGAPVRELAHAGRPGADAGEIEHGEAGQGLRGARERHSEGCSWPGNGCGVYRRISNTLSLSN